MTLPGLSVSTRIRIARPSRDLAAVTRFYVEGLGLTVLYQSDGEGEAVALTIVGLPGAAWHLEFTRAHEHALLPAPTEEDLLVLYLNEPAPETFIRHLEAHGGVRVPAANPYWARWGVTVQDPDGYRLVLSQRIWTA